MKYKIQINIYLFLFLFSHYYIPNSLLFSSSRICIGCNVNERKERKKEEKEKTSEENPRLTKTMTIEIMCVMVVSLIIFTFPTEFIDMPLVGYRNSLSASLLPRQLFLYLTAWEF